MNSQTDNAVSVRNLVKTFGKTRALDGLDLTVNTGEVHGFLGPNGSGKTTTIRVLLGLLRADSGDVRLLGGDPWRQATELHKRLAYVPGDVTLWPTLSGGEVIDMLGRMRGGLNRQRRNELLERFDLDPKKKGRAYSKGNKQKVGLVAALASDVELLILDEPTSGLDPLMEEVFQQCINEERRRGRTVLLSSHVLAEVEALCDRVTIIRLGRTVETGTLSDMRHLTRTSIAAELAAEPNGLGTLAGIHNLQVEGTRVHFEADTESTRRGAASAHVDRCPKSDQPATDVGRALPAALPGRPEKWPVAREHGGVVVTAMAGTGSLVRLALRRDRLMLVVWILIFVVMAAGSAGATVGLYATVEQRIQAAASINNTPSLVALYGLIYDPSSLGALAMIKLGAFGGALVAVLAIVLVIRHTRAEEEAGRLELVGSTVIGRHAPLAAALIVTAATNVVLGLLTALGLIGSGLPAAGSVAFGLAWASVGVAFAGVAAIAAQITSSARGAIGIAMAFLGVVYVLRAIGDTNSDGGLEWLRWLSPIGWGQQVRAYQGDRWWVLVIPVAFSLLLTAVAFVLVAQRDHGAGLLPDRTGKAEAGRSLGGSLGLAWRLQRGPFIGWLVAFAILGFVFGNIATNIGTFLESPGARDLIQKLGGVQGLTDAFMSTELGMMGVILSVYGIQVVLRLRAEESELRAEPVLATGVGRISWAWSHIVIALLGTTAIIVAAGLAAGLSYSAQTGHSSDFGRVFLAAIVRLPAVWVLVGITVAAFGFAPRAAVVGLGGAGGIPADR